MTAMRILIQIKAVFIGIFLLIFLLLPLSLVAIPFSLERRLKIISTGWRFFGKSMLRYACHAKILISEDKRSGPFRGVPSYGLYVANHQSYLDIPLLLTKYVVPPIMKKEILYIPVFGWLGWIGGALPVSRGKMSSRRRVFDQARRRILKERIGLQVYPEGTRSRSSLPKTFPEIKKTLLVWAFNEKIAVVPTSIYGTRGILSPNGMIRPGRRIGIIVHKEIDPKDFETANAFAETCWNLVIEGHDQMRAQLGPQHESLS